MAKTKIVLIEDDEILSKVIYEELTDADFDVKQAFDGEEGLMLVRSVRPDLVLLDVVLPKKDGFTVLEELKKSPDTTAIPVIMLTMLGQDVDIKKGLQLGANDYIVKSQHAVGEIVDKIKDFFGKEAHPEAEKPRPSPPPSSRALEGQGKATPRPSPPSLEATEGHSEAPGSEGGEDEAKE